MNNEDFHYLKMIGNIEYEHNINLAPSKKLFDDYKSKLISWEEFEVLFKGLLEERNAVKQLGLKKSSHSCLNNFLSLHIQYLNYIKL